MQNLIKKDLFLTTKFKSNQKNKNLSTITIQTKNSLYNIAKPYVIWKVLKNSSTLIRAESAYKNGFYHVDIAMKDCKIFQIIKGKKGYLIYIKNTLGKEFIYEVSHY